ncbi:MAG: hypothetical protein Q9227_007103 [Pyrenula ochraceoflavens]
MATTYGTDEKKKDVERTDTAHVGHESTQINQAIANGVAANVDDFMAMTCPPVNAYPSFLNVFGIKAPDGTLNIPPSWQNGIGAATNCGEVIGLQVRKQRANILGNLMV